MVSRKIQDEGEIVAWIEAGKTYKWMAETYLDKYNLQVSPTMFSNFRARKGIENRIVRDDNLIPWEIAGTKHRWAWPAQMLRIEGRRRASAPISPLERDSVDGWVRGMKRDEVVVHYDPDTEQGWFYVRPRPGIDEDLIREPSRRTTRHPASI